MAKSISTSRHIAAPPAVVWRLLTDFARMPEWNPFIRDISGDLRPGARLDVRVAPPGSKGMRFRPRVLVSDPERELRWRGSLGLPGLFDGEHYFRLTSQGGGTLFDHGETFSGVLTLAFGQAALDATREGFEQMNDALARRAQATP